jgi:hypothetical protein
MRCTPAMWHVASSLSPRTPRAGTSPAPSTAPFASRVLGRSHVE